MTDNRFPFSPISFHPASSRVNRIMCGFESMVTKLSCVTRLPDLPIGGCGRITDTQATKIHTAKATRPPKLSAPALHPPVAIFHKLGLRKRRPQGRKETLEAKQRGDEHARNNRSDELQAFWARFLIAAGPRGLSSPENRVAGEVLGWSSVKYKVTHRIAHCSGNAVQLRRPPVTQPSALSTSLS